MTTLLTAGRLLSVFLFMASSLSGTDGSVNIGRP